MKSKALLLSFLIVLLFTAFQNSHSQNFTSIKFNTDSVLFDGSNVNVNYHSGCAGRVSALKGCAKIIKPGGECGTPPIVSDASVGSTVVDGDRIQVCSKSFVDITMPDGSVLRGAPGAEISIDETTCQSARSFSLRLFLGGVWSEVAPYIGGEDKYEVKTENAVVGSRGTKFYVRYVIDTTKYDEETVIERKTIVTVLEGKVEVWNVNQITLTDAATQAKILDDYQNGRITLDEFTTKMTEITNNYKLLVEAGMETMIYNDKAPAAPVNTNYTLEHFTQEKILGR